MATIAHHVYSKYPKTGESPEGMAKMPDYIREYMSTIPTRWDDIHFIDGYPGKYIIMARKSDNTWYIAGINGEKTEKEISFLLPFITKDNAAILITDGETNRSFSKSVVQLKSGKKVTLKLKPTGGFVIKMNV